MTNLSERRRPLYIPTLEEARKILGGKLPSIIENTTFTSEGLAQTPHGLKVPVYLANGLGFNEPGRHYIERVIKSRMEQSGALVLDPFQQCGELLNPEVFNPDQTVASQLSAWKQFNRDVIGTVNYGLLIPRSLAMFAVMEGYPTDEGVASEVAYMAANFGPVVGVRSDFRLAENPATGSKPAVTFFMGGPNYGGGYFEGPTAYDDAFSILTQINTELLHAAQG